MVSGGIVGEIGRVLDGIVGVGEGRSDAWVEGSRGRYNDRIVGKYCAAVDSMPFMVYGGVVHYYYDGCYRPVRRDWYDGVLMTVMMGNGVSGSAYELVCRSTWKILFRRSVDRLDRGLVSFANGVVMMGDDGESDVMGHGPEHLVTYRLDYDYVKGAKCPMWENFLSEVLPDKGLRMILQEYLGCVFIDRRRTKLEKMLFLYGGGSNGKGVVFETINGLLGGGDNVTYFDMKDLYGTLEAKRNMMTINGKLLNYCSDASSRSILSEMAKSLISGEPQPGRGLYSENDMVTDIPLMMANTNKLPFTKDYSFSFKRRLIIIPFNVTITEAEMDKELPYKLRMEYSGIMNWVLEGRRRFVRNGCRFTESDVAERVLENYFENTLDVNYSVAEFMDGMGYVSFSMNGAASAMVQPKVLYDIYKEWAVRRGVNNAVFDVGQFTKNLVRLGYRKKVVNGYNNIIVFANGSEEERNG